MVVTTMLREGAVNSITQNTSTHKWEWTAKADKKMLLQIQFYIIVPEVSEKISVMQWAITLK